MEALRARCLGGHARKHRLAEAGADDGDDAARVQRELGDTAHRSRRAAEPLDQLHLQTVGDRAPSVNPPGPRERKALREQGFSDLRRERCYLVFALASVETHLPNAFFLFTFVP